MKFPKTLKNNAKYLLYGLYNTVLVSGIDIPIMKSVTDWNYVNSHNLIYCYNALFTGIRVLPPILLYLKNKSKLELAKYFQTFFLTCPFQDAFAYGVQGMNPISPFGNTDWGKPYHYPWGDKQFSVRDYFATSFSLAGVIELAKRLNKKVNEIIYKSNKV